MHLSNFFLQAGNGRTWYIHVVYKVRSSKRRKNKHRQRRDIDGNINDVTTEENVLHHMASSIDSMKTRQRRSKQDASAEEFKEIKSIGRKKGTNLMMLRLNRPRVAYISEQEDKNTTKKTKTNPILICGIVGGLLVFLLVIAFLVYRNFVAASASKRKETHL